MTTPINMALYRFLVSQGATEDQAEAAARLDTADATAVRADLAHFATKADLANLKADLIMWMAGLTVAQVLAIAALIVGLR